MADDVNELRERVVRLEVKVDTHAQVIEGVRLIAQETRDTSARVEGLVEDVGRVETELHAAEDRRRRADRELEARLVIAVERVERACIAGVKRLEDATDGLGKRLDTTATARISGRATITAAALAAAGGLLTLIATRILGG